MSHAITIRHKKPTKIIILLFIIFFAPMILAWIIFTHHNLLSRHTTNKGTLIFPPFSFTHLIAVKPSGKWMLVLVDAGACHYVCEKDLYYLRQIRTATGKDEDRVKRAIITFDREKEAKHLTVWLEEHFSGTAHFNMSKHKYVTVLHKYFNRPFVAESGTIFLVDPMGNVMMGYPPRTPPHNIYLDLKKLLSASQIG